MFGEEKKIVKFSEKKLGEFFGLLNSFCGILNWCFLIVVKMFFLYNWDINLGISKI